MVEAALISPVGEGMVFIEERILNAWPGLQQIIYDGWLLRFANGYTRRANSVIPLGKGRLEVGEKIRTCEVRYGHRGLPAVFKVLPFMQPPELDMKLEGAGYFREAETSVQLCEADRLGAFAERQVLTWSEPVPAWIDAYARCSGKAAAEIESFRAIMANVMPECCFAVLMDQGQPVCCGIGVCEAGYFGIFSLVTEKGQRNRGFARALIGHLGRWGNRCGAGRAYLSVMVDNEPAWHLYGRLGFVEIYRYWYRVKEECRM